jgi:hypothetical protein
MSPRKEQNEANEKHLVEGEAVPTRLRTISYDSYITRFRALPLRNPVHFSNRMRDAIDSELLGASGKIGTLPKYPRFRCHLG